jgi:hypothetical protein
MRAMRALGYLGSCIAIACGSSSHELPDARGDSAARPDAPPAALGPLMPQETAGNASAVMASPTVVAITYNSDPNRADVEAFLSQYAASPAWAMQTSEYGIGALQVGTPRHLPAPVATSDAKIRQVLTTNLTGATPAWGAPSQSTLYSFTLPEGTTFDDPRCCGGYHDDVIIGGVDVAYSIQCPCSTPPPTLTPLQGITFAIAHELVEGVTDPRYEHVIGWGDVDGPHQVWSYVSDGELADLCEFVDTAFWTDAPGMIYTIQRIWSNAAARAGTDPCVGAPTTPYYQSVLDQPDDVTITVFGAQVPTKGTRIAIGASGALSVRIAGTPRSGPFKLTAIDVASLFFGAPTPLLRFTQPSGEYQVGDTVTIPVMVTGKDANLGTPGAEAFELDTHPVNGGPTTYFYGLVAQ